MFGSMRDSQLILPYRPSGFHRVQPSIAPRYLREHCSSNTSARADPNHAGVLPFRSLRFSVLFVSHHRQFHLLRRCKRTKLCIHQSLVFRPRLNRSAFTLPRFISLRPIRTRRSAIPHSERTCPFHAWFVDVPSGTVQPSASSRR